VRGLGCRCLFLNLPNPLTLARGACHRAALRADPLARSTSPLRGEVKKERGARWNDEGNVKNLVRIVCAVAFALGGHCAWAADQSTIAAAKKEGEVVWYTTLIVNQIVRPLKAAFEKKYPGVTLQYSRADDLVTSAKILAEGQAGRVQADIFDGIANMLPLQEAGLLAPFTVPNAADYPPELKARDGYWIAEIMYVFTPGINTTLLPKDQAPKTFADLLDPKLAGKMAWNGSSMAGAYGFVGNVLITMGDDNGMAYLRALATQRVVNVEASSRAVLDQVIAGEYWMNLMAFNHHVVISARKGAPCDWLKLEPAPVTLDAVGLLKDAPHPNAARLLLEFLLSPEGQKVFQQSDYLPALPSVPAMVAGLKPSDGGFKADFLRPEQIHRELPQWQKVTEDLFR
jgi:ABC-type Fe3+ transport system substrate-binding protein